MRLLAFSRPDGLPGEPATSGIYDDWYHRIAVSRLQMVGDSRSQWRRENCQKSLRVVS
jgi:hypothetical protein